MEQYFATIETHHGVDDEATAPDQAMSEFITFTMFSRATCKLSDDGRGMLCRVMDPDQIGAYLVRARSIISVFHLPLAAQPTYSVGEAGLRAFLSIKYTGR